MIQLEQLRLKIANEPNNKVLINLEKKLERLISISTSSKGCHSKSPTNPNVSKVQESIPNQESPFETDSNSSELNETFVEVNSSNETGYGLLQTDSQKTRLPKIVDSSSKDHRLEMQQQSWTQFSKKLTRKK
jgi:hypothetical protein